MRVRGIDADNDWLYGKGANDYRQDTLAIAQNIKTRLQSFLGDCFFDVNAGVDWFNLLGAKDLTALKLSIASTILNTEGVVELVQLFFDLNPANRDLSISYAVNTIYSSSIRSQLSTDNTVRLLVTESGDFITTEDGRIIEVNI